MLVVSELKSGRVDILDGKDEIEELVEVFGLGLVVEDRDCLDERSLDVPYHSPEPRCLDRSMCRPDRTLS
jgi:hypothetical protein